MGVDRDAAVSLELRGREVDAAPDLFVGQIREEALDVIDP
jgi:hypothetical protein